MSTARRQGCMTRSVDLNRHLPTRAKTALTLLGLLLALLWVSGVAAAWMLDRERVDREVQDELHRISILATAERQRFFSASGFWHEHIVRGADGQLTLDLGSPALRTACQRLRDDGARSALVWQNRRWACDPADTGLPVARTPDADERATLERMARLTYRTPEDTTRVRLDPKDTAPAWLMPVWDGAPPWAADAGAMPGRVVGYVQLEMPVAAMMDRATSRWEHAARVQYRALALGSVGTPTRVLWSQGSLPARAYTDSLGVGYLNLAGSPLPMRLYASQALEPVATVMVGTASVLGLLFGTLWWLSWRLLASRVRLAEVLARRTARAQHRQRALADSREVNRALVGAARQAGAVVRQRLGAELHDNTGQLLTAAQLQARHLALVVDPMLQPACETLADTLRDAAKAVRELSHDWHLAPTHAADAPDLLAELGRLAERSRPLPVELVLPHELPGWDAEACHALLRIAQEAVSNALRHARASAIRLLLSPGPDELLRIEDDGVGFDAGRVEGGVGLASMHARAAALGARLAVDRSSGWTRVSVTTA